MKIESIELKEFNSYATVSFNDTDVYLVCIEYDQYSVVNTKGEKTESYRDINEALESEFLPAFMILKDLNRRMTSFIPINVLSRLSKSEKSFSFEDNTAVAANSFTANGIERRAVIEKDSDGNCLYRIFDCNGRTLEIYGALFLALSSPYYPVLAELDKYIDSKIAGENENENG